MARESKNRPRDTEGRFVKPRDAASSATRAPDRERTGTRRSGLGQPAVLSLAIVMGVAGFAFSLLGCLIDPDGNLVGGRWPWSVKDNGGRRVCWLRS
jgi:hypothetical protein